VRDSEYGPIGFRALARVLFLCLVVAGLAIGLLDFLQALQEGG
jgi:hypothetical protein